MLIRQYNFPEYIYQGDEIHDMYSDRAYYEWREACDKFGNFENCSQNNFLEFCKIVVGYKGDNAKGCRVVRFTDVPSGYPCFRVDLYICNSNKLPKLYSSNINAPNIEGPKRDMWTIKDLWRYNDYED
jgi:hypothetical protein